MTEKTNRREFLSQSTAAAVGAGVVSQIVLPRGAYAANGDETIRIGLVGCGGRGTGAASQALSTQGDVQLIAVADAFDDQMNNTLNRLSKQHGERVSVDEAHKFTGFDAYKKLIDLDEIDLVILATPPGFRPIHFEYAVEKGKHVFFEKPVAVDAKGVRKVLKAVEESKKKNLKVGVGLQRHHQPAYLETVKALQDGAIGDILALRVYWNSGGVWEPRRNRDQVKTEMEYQMRNWYYYNWLCGDHITEQHIHNLDVGCWVKGAYPIRAYGMGGREVRDAPRYGNIYDHFAVEYEFADGTRMYSQCRHIRNCWNSVSEHAQGTKGTSNIGSSYTTQDGNTWRYQKKQRREDPYQIEHDDLFAAIRNDTSYNEGEYGAHSTMTSILGRMAVYSGKPVDWDKALNEGADAYPWAEESLTWNTTPPHVPNDNGEYEIPVPGVTDVFEA